MRQSRRTRGPEGIVSVSKLVLGDVVRFSLVSLSDAGCSCPLILFHFFYVADRWADRLACAEVMQMCVRTLRMCVWLPWAVERCFMGTTMVWVACMAEAWLRTLTMLPCDWMCDTIKILSVWRCQAVVCADCVQIVRRP